MFQFYPQALAQLNAVSYLCYPDRQISV
jgi:hypothetical protein